MIESLGEVVVTITGGGGGGGGSDTWNVEAVDDWESRPVFYYVCDES